MHQMTCHAFIATTLDGFIARKNGSIDWLEKANAKLPPGIDCGFEHFFNQMDCIILGRRTFETIANFTQWPYGQKPVIVMTRHSLKVPTHRNRYVEVSSEPIDELILRLKEKRIEKIYVDGGKLIQSFINKNLLNEITITRIPILLGEGIPLFGPTLLDEINLKLIKSQSWRFGFVQDHYEIQNSNPI